MGADKPLLVIVTGPPASGKTTLAAEVADQLGLPMFHKDAFKERMAGEIPGSDLTWSHSLGAAAYELLYLVGQTLLDAGLGCVLEANFHPELSLSSLRPLTERATVAQIVCTGDPEHLLARYRERERDGQRHSVHMDIDTGRRELLETAFQRDHRLALDGLTMVCDTTLEQPVDAGHLVAQIRAWLSTAG